MCAEPHRKIGERSLEILESAIDREDLLVGLRTSLERPTGLSRLDPASRAADTSRYLCAVNSGLP